MNEAIAGNRFGRYRLIRELGRGGEAVVHLAEDVRLGRTVAVKIFPGLAAIDDPESPARVRREVEMLSRLDHPGICCIHEAGVEAGLAFIAMSYVEGRSLEAERDRGLDLRDAVRAIEEVSRVVHHAHSAGVVHGDLKPANIVVKPDGGFVVLDFGLAPILDASWRCSDSSRLAGSLPYLAPECLAREPDARADVWSLGAVLFELVTGRTPFVAPTRVAMIARLTREEPPLARHVVPSIPRDLEAVLAKALARDPRRRYATAAAFAGDLGRFLRGDPVRARKPGVLDAGARLVRRHPAAAALAGFLFAFLTVVTWVARVKGVALDRHVAEAEREADRALRAAGDAARHLARHERLADRRRLADLEARASRLFPPSPEMDRELEAWLADARALADRLDGHRRSLEDLRSRGTRASTPRLASAVSPSVRREIADLRARGPEAQDVLRRLDAALPHVDAWTYRDAADAIQAAGLSDLVEALERFVDPDPHRGAIASVSKRLEDSRRLRALMTGTQADAWARASAAIADRSASPKYDGLTIAPQVGLVPLRQDSASGLWEFLHVLSGEAPQIGDDGSDQITGATGIVLVLLPGGPATFGARRRGEEDPVDGPHLDPEALGRESPVGEIRLEPFFIAKFEMTQDQWFRATGEAPRAVSRQEWERMRRGGPAPARPASWVSWHECAETLRRLGLGLPTEVQWEYAARAGTTTPWWTGPKPESLRGAEIFDARDERAVGDGRPNPFGLHDVLGNVAEWCRDPFGRYTDPIAPGTGERFALDLEHRMRRGGAYSVREAAGARVSTRSFDPPAARRADTGVRPARALDGAARPLPR